MTAALCPRRVEPPRPSEALLAACWQHQWLRRGRLVDSDGRELRVVYPGRRWGGAGPDFQGAMLATPDGTLLRGDIEVHLRASAWNAHGHQRDPAYNHTILQVVLGPSDPPPVRTADGRVVPSLCLAGRLDAPLAELAARLARRDPPEAPCLTSPQDALLVVEHAGLERFLERAGSFESDLEVLSPLTLLVRGAVSALGYGANREACSRLAEQLSWELIAAVGRGSGGEQRLRALLLGCAGLLPAQRGLAVEPGEAAALERIWRRLGAELGLAPLPLRIWQLRALRPSCWPSRRLAGGAALLAGWANDPAPTAIFERVLQLQSRPARLAALFRARSVQAYWVDHADFGRPLRPASGWQIGASRAIEIAVNVVLPLTYALGQASERPELAAAALLAFRGMPSAGWNRVTRAMALQIVGHDSSPLFSSAIRQQGLLRLYRGWCDARECGNCPAGHERRARSG